MESLYEICRMHVKYNKICDFWDDDERKERARASENEIIICGTLQCYYWHFEHSSETDGSVKAWTHK